MTRSLALGAIGAILCISAASAHVTLEKKEAPIGASYKAVLRVPHGCSGSATTQLKVQIPEGFVNVKPMAKPGWQILTVGNKYKKTFTLHGAKLSEGVVEIDWWDGQLYDEWYDEFAFIGTFADELQAGSTLYFKVVQECQKGVHRWIELPDPDTGQVVGDEPAPKLKLLPKQ